MFSARFIAHALVDHIRNSRYELIFYVRGTNENAGNLKLISRIIFLCWRSEDELDMLTF